MEVYQKLIVFVNSNLALKFRTELINEAKKNKWLYRSDFEEDYIKNVMTDDIIICLESPKFSFNNNTDLQAFVWMRHSKNEFEVFNIIPSLTRKLTYEQYNFILDQLYKCVVKKVAVKLELDTMITSPYKSMTEIIGEEAYERLYRFSRSANKSTGNTNPFDFERWCEFVFTLFRQNVKLNSDEFVRWLEENEGWSEDLAWKLAVDLEYALDILEKYEHSK